MPLAEYLASEQAREDVRQLFDGDKPRFPVMSMEDLCLVRDEVGAWRSVMIWDDNQNKELTAYYRPDGDRYVVTDLGEGVRALRLKGVALLDIKPRVDAVMMAMWQEQTEFVAHYPAALIHGEVGTVNHPKAESLPDAICRVMLASLRVAEAVL